MTAALPLDRVELVGAGRTLTGLASFGDESDTPLLLLIHGGGVNAHYFAVPPGDSVLELAADNGFSAVAINRPGYADSDEVDAGEATFAQQAEVIDAAMEELWRAKGAGHPGVVVFGHSIGGAITVHLAARHPSWPLLGISITGIAAAAPPFIVQLWESMLPGQRSLTSHVETWEQPTPPAELLEIATRWPDEFAAVGERVTVPVQYAVGELDKLWVVTEQTAADCAAVFTNAQYVDAQLLPGVGHAVEHDGVLGRSHQLRQLSFALHCTGLPQLGSGGRTPKR